MYEMNKNTKLWVYHNNTFGEYLFTWIKIWHRHVEMQTGNRTTHSMVFPGLDFSAANRGEFPAQRAAGKDHLKKISCFRSWEMFQAIHFAANGHSTLPSFGKCPCFRTGSGTFWNFALSHSVGTESTFALTLTPTPPPPYVPYTPH